MNLNMDSFVNKLRHTVSQVAYQVNTSVNTIIPGNPIHRDYELLKQRCTHGCPGFVWIVYDAVKRDSSSIKASLKDAIGPNLISTPIPSTIISNSSFGSSDQPTIEPANQTSSNTNNHDKQLYSVFVFDKSQLDSLSNRGERETVLDHLKKGVTKLTRLRHPSILTIHHPLEESRSSLCFVTEHVYGNLDSILKEQRSKRIGDNKNKKMGQDLVDLTQDLGPKDSDYYNDSCQLDEVQIKAGLLQICDGIKFLHNDAKMLHRNICLNNIFVDSNNTWKIAGFDFASQSADMISSGGSNINTNDNNNLQIMEFNPKISNLPQYPSLKTSLTNLPSSIVPNWSCSAPEHSNSDKVTLYSDIYSLGIISCALLGSDMDMIDLSYEYGLISDTYKRGIHFRELADKLPLNVKTSIMKYAAINVDSRPSLDDYLNLAIFNDQQIQAIRDLDSQFAWDRLRKIDFFNRLRDILPKLSHQIKINRIAKSLFNEIVNQDMIPYVLPNILIIAKDSTPSEFKAKIFPNLKQAFRVLEPKAVPLLLLDNLLILADRAKLCLADFQLTAFTLIQYLLRMDQQMQEKCLVILPTVKRFIDNGSMIRIILPELNRLSRETNILTIRVKCLECIGSMVDSMENTTIINNVLPIIFDVTSRETDVIMAAVGAIKTIVNNSQANLTRVILAGKVLPFLMPLSVEKELNLQQFNIIMSLIKNILDRVERKQREILSRKHQASSVSKSGPLVLSEFKGSNHFQLG